MVHTTKYCLRYGWGTIVVSWLLLFAPVLAEAQPSNGWKPLGNAYTEAQLQQLLVPVNQWKPYASYQDPAGFSTVPVQTRQEIIREGEKFLHTSWPALPATTFLEFVRNGNRTDYEALSFGRRKQLAALVLAEVFERKGRFIDQIINGIWAISEESFWGVPAHLNLQKAGHGLPDVADPVVDLFAAETAQELAWTYYLLKPELDKVNPLIAARIVYEAKKRILLPYLKHDNWDYLGFNWKKNPSQERRVNNWNPWINSNVLATALLLGNDPVLRAKVVEKTMESVDNFVLPYPEDGGSDEGPDYWGRAAASLIDYLELLKSATNGKIDVFDRPILKKMGQYVYETYIAGPYYYNYGDADAKYHPDPALLFRFGTDTHDSVLMRYAAFQARQQDFFTKGVHESFGVLNRMLPALFVLHQLKETPPEEALLEDVWLPNLQIMAARSTANSAKGFYLAAKGGTNGESHNHNDVGSFIVYYDGNPVLIDAGAQTYTAQTFSSARYQLWNNQSAYHNLPNVNGYTEHAGATYRSSDVRYVKTAASASLSMSLREAYPRQAAIKRWDRTVTLERGKRVTLTERYQLDKFLAPTVENFLTPLSPDITGAGVVVLPVTTLGAARIIRLRYDARDFSAAVDTIPIRDGQPVDANAPGGSRTGRMYGNWGGVLYRVRLVSKTKALKNTFSFTLEP